MDPRRLENLFTPALHTHYAQSEVRLSLRFISLQLTNFLALSFVLAFVYSDNFLLPVQDSAIIFGLTAVLMTVGAQYGIYRRFRDTCCFHVQGAKAIPR